MRRIKAWSVLMLCLFFQSLYAQGTEKRVVMLGPGKKAQADLDGDGKVEVVTLYAKPGGHRWAIWVNDDKVFVDSSSIDFDGFNVIDLDTTDKYKEIVVRLNGPCTDFYVIYEFRNKSIRKIGAVGEVAQFCGDGSIIVKDYSMSFWTRTLKYVLTRQRTIELVPQEFYYVGKEGVVEKGFPIYAKRGSKVVVDIAKPGEKVLILLSDCSSEEPEQNWYLIKTERNILGWIYMKTFGGKIGGLVWGG